MNYALKSALNNFKIHNNELMLDDISISSLAEQYGTPLYIYDRNLIRKKSLLLGKMLPTNLHVSYAVKANPHLKILELMGALYDGFDVASAGEMERVLQAEIESSRINFTGPGKTVSELRYAIENRIGGISLESEQEFEHIRSICKELDQPVNVLVRVNPAFELSKSGMKMGGGAKAFGIDSERVPELLKNIEKDPLVNFNGIHIFAGSQNLVADEILQTFEHVLNYAVTLSEQTGININKLNLGGGFGVPIFPHERDLDIHTVGEGLKELLARYETLLRETSFNIELGRYLIAESGLYVSKILYKKISRGQVFLITDGGMHHHLAASGNFGQSLARRSMPLTVANKQGYPTERVHVVGPLCTPLDTFGYVDLPEAQPGDLIAVLNSGAYGYSASPHFFLSHPAPKEILVHA